MEFQIGVDVGGTFTDCVVAESSGRVHIFKVLSDAREPAKGLMKCLEKAAQVLGQALAEFLARVSRLTYGTTAATNILIEGRGAPVCLLTTRGFKDTLPIARMGREYLGIDLQCDRFEPLIPRRHIYEVTERIDSTGAVITPLAGEDLKAVFPEINKNAFEAIAICTLWSFKNPQHEQAIVRDIRSHFPETYVSASHEVAPILGEYERTVTTVLNARLGPPLSRQFRNLSAQLEGLGFRQRLFIMQSTGGVTSIQEACRRPITLVNSGPAGGVIACKTLASMLEKRNVICADMGGTSFDVCLITAGQHNGNLVSRICGHNAYVPTLDIHSVGAGGGSIAWLDRGRRLKVGPGSAGAFPGPACYGRKGSEPTVTDANVVLGRANPKSFLGGELPIDREKAWEAIATRIAEPLGMGVLEAARGIIDIVNANMANAVRRLTVDKGLDARDYGFVAFGGAGPMHGALIAAEMGIRDVIIPALATVQSAFGILTSDIVQSYSYSDVMGIDDPERLNRGFAKMEQAGRESLAEQGFGDTKIDLLRFVAMRFKGQSHEVALAVPPGRLTQQDMVGLVESFEAKYASLYGEGTQFRQAGYEIVTLHLDIVVLTEKVLPGPQPASREDPRAAVREYRDVLFEAEAVKTPVFTGEKLGSGQRLRGPAIIEYYGTTVITPPGWSVFVDPYLNLHLRDER